MNLDDLRQPRSALDARNHSAAEEFWQILIRNLELCLNQFHPQATPRSPHLRSPLMKLPLVGKYGHGKQVLIDDEDYKLVADKRWHYGKSHKHKNKWYVYAIQYLGTDSTGKQNFKKHYLHRLVMGNPDAIVDHINSNTLDCRKANLRICSKTFNNFNKSKRVSSVSPCKSSYLGVAKSRDRWKVRITAYGETYQIGSFSDEVTAAKNRDYFCLIVHGEYARLNFPELDYTNFTPAKPELAALLRSHQS
jgi:hypothetical protein